MPFFSIIVPVYNVQEYLKDTVDSVLRQQCDDYELILVDDASKDNSGAICNAYAAQYPEKIQVIHKQNGGAAQSRNYGIKAAKGSYLVFLDSDDQWGDPALLAKAKDHIMKHDCDIVMFGYVTYRQTNGEIGQGRDYKELGGLYTMGDLVPALVKGECFRIAPWSKIIRGSCIELFDETLKSQEDIEWVVRQFKRLKTAYIMNEKPYIYRIREGSLSEQNTWHVDFQILEMNLENLNQPDWNPEVQQGLLHYMAYQYGVMISEIGLLQDTTERNEALSSVEKYKYLLQYSAGKKVALVRTLSRFLGLKTAVNTLGLYRRVKIRR